MNASPTIEKKSISHMSPPRTPVRLGYPRLEKIRFRFHLLNGPALSDGWPTLLRGDIEGIHVDVEGVRPHKTPA